MTPAPPTRHIAGPIISALLTLLLAALGVMALQPDVGYGVILLLMVALFVCAPLALLLLAVWVYYLVRKPAPGWVHAAMWLPPLAAASIVPVADEWRNVQWSHFAAAHPTMHEAHVNLSGRDMLPDLANIARTNAPRPQLMPGNAPERPLPLRRGPYIQGMGNPEPADMGYDWLYAGGRIAPTATDMLREDNPDRIHAAAAPVTGTRLPLRAPPAYPVARGLPHEVRQYFDSALEHRFFHYPDRTEVGVVLRLSGSQSLALEQAGTDMVEIAVFPLAGEPVARMQIEGQELALGPWGLPAPPGHAAFDPRCLNSGGYVRLPLAGSWRVRWHGTQAPHTWHEALLAVPAFASGERAAGALRTNRMDIYVLPGAQLTAQRVQLREPRQRPRYHTALRATPLSFRPPCGDARQRADSAGTEHLAP
ncbi:MAG: hypothetical protein Q4G71_09805 [Pseudomonadota bacterium]|nr:hypothetical protein [Pseudomonadota bacterium]